MSSNVQVSATTIAAVSMTEMSDADLSEVTGGASVYNDNDGQVYQFTEGDGSVADRFASAYFNP